MQTRTLGNGGLEVSAIGFGCMGMSFGYGPARDTREMTALTLGAAALTLSGEDLREIEMSSLRIPVQGARYPEAVEKMTGL